MHLLIQFNYREQTVPPSGCGRLLLLIFALQALKFCPKRHHQLITAVPIN